MKTSTEAPIAADPTPIAADDTYDVYSVMDMVPKVVTELLPGDSRAIALVSAFIGVGSAAIGASGDSPPVATTHPPR